MNSSVNALNFPHAPATARPSAPAQPGRLARWGTAVWKALECVGQARARRELLILADRWETGRPELAAQLRAASRRPADL